MDSETPLDFALFELSPRRSRCELYISKDGKTEKIAAGLFKPFLSQLKAAEELEAQSTRSIKLDVERKRGNGGSWFHKGTLERFVRFVSTPELLEVISTLDAETSQLEGAKRTYGEGARDRLSKAQPGENATYEASTDVTKKELLRAIDVRLAAVKQELSTACARASAAGFTLESISDLRLFADYFGAQRLNIACSKFLSLCQRRPELITQPLDYNHQLSPPITWKTRPAVTTAVLGPADRDVRGSSGSDMSIDDTEDAGLSSISHPLVSQKHTILKNNAARNDTIQSQLKLKLSSSSKDETSPELPPHTSDLSRRLSVQDRISMFENKQKEQSGVRSSGRTELRRQSSDLASVVEKAVSRRWSGASDMSLDLSGGNSNSSSRKETDVTSDAPSSSSVSNPRVLNNEENDTADSRCRSSSLGTVSMVESQREKTDSRVKQLQESHDSLRSSAMPSPSLVKQKPEDVNVFLSQPEAFVGIGATRSAALGSRLSQKIPLGEAEDPRTQSSGRNFVKQPENSGKLAKASQESQPKEEYSDFQGGQISVPEMNDESHMKSDPGFVTKRTPESPSVSRPYKGSQGLNEELQMKADELEKFYAAHKLRLQTDQASVSKRGRTLEKIALQEQRSPKKGPESNYKMVVGGNQGSLDTPKKSTLDAGFLENSRGKLYEKYLQKREAKLREEWVSNRDQKEGRMKKMHDDFEHSRAEMARLTKSAGKLDSRTMSRRRDKNSVVSSFSRPAKTIEKVDFLTSKDDDSKDLSSRQIQRGQEVGNNSFRTGNSRVLPLTNSRASVIDMQSEGDFPALNSTGHRKENAQPVSGQVKDGARSPLRGSTRSKSINEDNNFLKEEKNSRLSQSMRRPSLGPIDSDDLRPSRNSQTRTMRPGQGSRLQSGLSAQSAHKLKHLTREEEEEQEATLTPDSWEEGDDDAGADDGDLAAALVYVPASSKLSSSSGIALESPAESTGSWNEASLDSSGSSPTQADASRMRKKWGNAQKPIVASNSSNDLQRDVPPKGFKRLLTLGRKQKGSECQIVDWISAPTAEV